MLIDHDTVGIHQHDRCGMGAARIDRLDMHAVPVAGKMRALLGRHADAVAGVETRSRRNQFYRLGTRAQMRAHHLRVSLDSAAGENDGIGVERRRGAIAAVNLDAGDAMAIRHHQPVRLALVANPHTRLFRGGEQLFDHDAAAADRLDARWTGAEIIQRRDEFDAVALQPSDGRGRVVCQRLKIDGIAASTASLKHVICKTGVDPVGRIEPHVRGRPACVAAGFVFARFLQHGDVDRQTAAARLFGRRERCCQPRRPVSDNDQFCRVLRHLRSRARGLAGQLISAPPSI